MKKLILILMLLVGCLHQPSSFVYLDSPHMREEKAIRNIKIYLDQDFGAGDKVAVVEAVEQWQYALNGYFRFEIDDHYGMGVSEMQEAERGSAWLILKINSKNEMVVGHDLAGKHITLAFVNNIGGNRIFVIRDRINNNQVKGIVMHEIGHLLGASHVNEDDDLMNPIYDNANSQCIDKNTMQQVAQFQHLKFDNLNYCVYLYDSSGVGLGERQ